MVCTKETLVKIIHFVLALTKLIKIPLEIEKAKKSKNNLFCCCKNNLEKEQVQ